ncbi:cation efflux protein [Parathielavia appendiculata]|uniref:Cation efflux protein n=1 Tax=Parathielavia appendiculata TaxID=2587402 RepID=A0AAN6Z5M8_9PEZI|nr:cation efflux protein [Parathielavia appendiculata]
MTSKFSDKRRVSVAVAISVALFFGEIAAAYKTGSLALMADAFHILNDVLSYGVTLAAILITKKPKYRQDLSFGWQRARVLGAFFNGSLLLAIAFSILLQSTERFISLKRIEDPMLVLIMGGVGLGLNIITAAFLHEHHGTHHHNLNQQQQRQRRQQQHQLHFQGDPDSEVSFGTALSSLICLHHDHSQAECPFDPDSHAGHRHTGHSIQAPGRDLGMLGAVLHVFSDCLSNVGVIIAALIVWLTSWSARYYADPAASIAISAMIVWSAIPLVKRSGAILLQSAPPGVNLDDIKHDIKKGGNITQIPGIISVHELHVWRLDQAKAVASAHIVVSDPDVASFMAKAKTIRECLHAYGIHSGTLQPELSATVAVANCPASSTIAETGNTSAVTDGAAAAPEVFGGGAPQGCQLVCGNGVCGHLMCCGGPVQV